MRKSRILALFLSVIMLISLIQLPAFAAAPAFRDTDYAAGHKYYLAPYGDELVHLDFYANGAARYVANNGGDIVSIDNNGVMSMNSKFVDKGATIISISAIAADGSSVKTGNFNPSGYPIGYGVNGTYVGTRNKFDMPFIHDFTPDTYCLSNGLIYNRNSFTMVSGATAGTSGYAFTVPTSEVVFENADVTSDASGNGYMIEAANKDFIGFRPHYGNYANSGAYRIFHSSVMQFDVKLSSEEDFNIAFVSSDNSILKWNHAENELENLTRYSNKGSTVTLPASVEPGWHTVKFMFELTRRGSGSNPYRVDYQRGALFFDDQLVVKDFELPTIGLYNSNPLKPTTTPNNVIRFEGSAGIDNFKYYGSSTPHAYNVGLDSTPKSGSTVGGSAQSYSFFSAAPCDNEPTTYEYTYYVSDSADTLGEKITSTNPADPLYITTDSKLAINGDYAGYFVKVGARACYRGGKSPEIISKTAYEIQGYETTTVTGGAYGKNARFRLAAPFEGDLVWSFVTAPEGVTLTEDGLFTVTDAPSGTGIFRVQDLATGNVCINNLEFIENSTDGTALSQAIEPVVFRADIDLTTTTNITAGTQSFTVNTDGIDGVACSDGTTFKFVVEDDVCYAFAGDTFISSDAFTQDITSITINGGHSNYYAGSPLEYEGTFISCGIVDACDSNYIETPAFEFYNESGVYPESYDYEWYINGSVVSPDARFFIPSGNSGNSIYCTITGVTDESVSVTSNTLTIGSQYNLTPYAPGEFEVSLNTENKDIYVFFVGDNKTVYVGDLSYGYPVYVSLDGSVNYNMFFVYKDTLAPRGIATRILTDTSYSDVTLPEGKSSNLVILTKNSDFAYVSEGPELFEDPVAHSDLSNILADNCDADITHIIRDAFIAPSVTTSYADSENQLEGAYNIISIDDAGIATETAWYNELYKFFADSANYSYANFKPIAARALKLTTEEIDVVKENLDQVINQANIASFMGTNGKYFSAAVLLQRLAEQSTPSDISLDLYKTHLEKSGLSTDVVSMMEFSTFYSDVMDAIVPSDGIETINNKLKTTMILREVSEGISTTNIRRALTLIGSSVFNNAIKEAQEFAAASVAKRSYANINELKADVEEAISKYKPEKNETNEDSKNDKPSSSVSVSGGSGSYIPVIPTPVPTAPRFSDAPATHWAYEYIEKMASVNVINGYNGSFRPEDDITRAEYVKVLCEAFGVKAEGEASFNDVSTDSWYAPYVNALASAGIAKGDNGNFRPDDKISRQDAAVLLERVLAHIGVALENGELTFSDTNDISDYAKLAVSSLVKAGVINGMDDGSYSPVNNITRAQVAKLICVAIELGGDK